ncbi:MAG: hypothetical protein KA533_09415 [Sphingobium sp.]|nr:hypothetical protein [Sphingobium sp.]MBP6112815.1 hypothetical protein [Sphingobium sp.]MBP8672044.1 hypothetical protein [Sphingobium sp.]MBP9158715.1 hypothetical protein [Sphingobium sp.]MCC6482811.1 hypothetical protein [Sphingomonadaceae bacterium]
MARNVADTGKSGGKRSGPLGDVIPDADGPDPRTGGGKPQEDVDDRPVVGTTTPEKYPPSLRNKG